MNVTIIPTDKTVVVDSIGYGDIDMSSVPSNIHALQWEDTEGTIEYNNLNNEEIFELPSWALGCIEQHQTFKTAEETAKAEMLAYLNSPEGKLEALRLKRNSLLAETDYLALSDNTLSTEIIEYRQALRDITKTYSSLDDAVFPTKPE